MCGLTLLPRKVRPTIFLVLMSMNAMSFESRSTIITTDVGSVTFTFGPATGDIFMVAMLCAGACVCACACAARAEQGHEPGGEHAPSSAL